MHNFVSFNELQSVDFSFLLIYSSARSTTTYDIHRSRSVALVTLVSPIPVHVLALLAHPVAIFRRRDLLC